MARIAYVNGAMIPLDQATISIQDRGFLFGDGIYEVTAVVGGHLVDYDNHAARLFRSLNAIALPAPVSAGRLLQLHQDIIAANKLEEGLVYLQITRGSAERDFGFPAQIHASLIMFTQSKPVIDNPWAKTGIKVVTTPDLRWKRCDIKSVSLLAQVIAKQEAAKVGAQEAWMVRAGKITEGSASSAYIIKNDEIITKPLSNAVLSGVTRMALLQLARSHKLKLIQRAFTLSEAYAADEAFITAATNFVMPVVSINDRPVGSGKPGPHSNALREAYVAFALAD